MTSNLRARFHKWQRKGLSESIAIDLFPSKKTYSTPGLNSPSKSTPPTPATVIALSLDEKPSAIDDISHHQMRKPFIVLGNINEDSFKCLNSSPLSLKPAHVPSREEVSEFLSHIPFFTKRESLVQDMRMLFSAMQQILVEVGEDPSQFSWHVFFTILQTLSFPALFI